MRKNIDVTVLKNNNRIFKKRVELDLAEQNKVDNLIQSLKSSVTEDLQNFEVEKEELFYGSRLMKLEESVPAKNGLELIITVK